MVHNELIDRVFCRINFKAYEWRLLWCIIRQSWGWRRKGVWTTYRELVERTGLDVRHVARTLKQLEQKLIIAVRSGKKKTHLQINTDYMSWRIPEIDTLFTVASSGNGRGNKVLPQEATLGVASSGNGDSPQTPAQQHFADRVNILLNKEVKKPDGICEKA